MEQPRGSFDKKFDNGRFSRGEAPVEPGWAEAMKGSREMIENDGGQSGAGNPSFSSGDGGGNNSAVSNCSQSAGYAGVGNKPNAPGYGNAQNWGSFSAGGGSQPNAPGYGNAQNWGSFSAGGGNQPNAPGYGNAQNWGSFSAGGGNQPNAPGYGNAQNWGGFSAGGGSQPNAPGYGNGAGCGGFPSVGPGSNPNAPGYGYGPGYGNFPAGGNGNYPNGSPYGGSAGYPNFPEGGGFPPNYGNNAGYPYPQWYGNNGYGPFVPPPKKSNIGIIVIVVLSVLVVLALIAGVFYGTYRLISSTYRMGERLYQTSPDTSDTYGDAPFAGEDEEEQAPGDEKKEYGDYGQDAEYYEGLANAARTDLSYSVSWEEYHRESGGEELAGKDSYISVKYPVIEGGDIPNLDNLNKAVASEIDEITAMYDEFSSYIAEDGTFEASAEGFVTYMDEDVMSVVFQETILYGTSEYYGYDAMVSLNSINLDMESGMVIDSNSIIDTDDEFAIDFRKRSEEQNGTVEDMDMMSDQQISDYLSGEVTGVAFFTPLGMEVGFNYEYGWVTVTYKDYDKYLRKF